MKKQKQWEITEAWEKEPDVKYILIFALLAYINILLLFADLHNYFNYISAMGIVFCIFMILVNDGYGKKYLIREVKV